jgi:ribosomal protein L16
MVTNLFKKNELNMNAVMKQTAIATRTRAQNVSLNKFICFPPKGGRKANKLHFGEICLKVEISETITGACQIKVARRGITRKIKKKGKVWVCTFLGLHITSKPSESRMGKEKGFVSFLAADKNPRTIKEILFDMFLKYQFTICVRPNIPASHLVPLCLLTYLFDSLYYISLYCVSILYILSTFYLAEKFPNSFGSWYVNFLKRNSSTENFNKYCGNPFSALKAAIKHPEIVKVIFKNGGSKAVAGVGAIAVFEHTMHKAKVGQIWEYQMEKHLNGGNSPDEPFKFKPNGPSMVEKGIAKTSS